MPETSSDALLELPFLREIVKMGDETFFAYSDVKEAEDYILETGRMDPFIRARGATIREALINLQAAVLARLGADKEETK